MIDVLFWDDRGGFGPRWNATRPVGCAEIHLLQVAEYLAGKGLQTWAFVHGGDREAVVDDDKVQYHEYTRQLGQHPTRTDVLIIVGCASLPSFPRERTYAFQVVDPRPHPERFEHLKGRAIMVCVSEWQASLFRSLGHETIVIPVPIPDEWYAAPDGFMYHDNGMLGSRPVLYDFVCVSSWNKGSQETIDAWDSSWGTLAVGSPYSHPDDAAKRCARKGVTWLGTLKRDAWVTALSSGRAVARVCTIGETFGVVDVAASAMGKVVYTLCTGDVGALKDTSKPFTDSEAWRIGVKYHLGGLDPNSADRFRASRVLPKWLELVGG